MRALVWPVATYTDVSHGRRKLVIRRE